VRLFVTQLTFGKPLQPLMVSLDLPPDCFRSITEPVAMGSETQHEAGAAPDLPPAAKLKLRDIAPCKGMSGPILWGMDTESKPGVAICHFLRLETQHLTNTPDFNASKFATLHPDNDPRLVHLAECFAVKSAPENLVNMLELVDQCLAQVKAQAVMQAGTSRFVEDTHTLVQYARKIYAQ
jgi:hypothetical protein